MAIARERRQVRLLGVTGRKRSELLLGTALQATTVLVLALPAWGQPAPNARPAGGTVVAGRATITRSANNTAIDQASQRAAIDWRSFNVGSQQQVTFTQPSSSAVALNRVTGPDPSQIAGRITANGQVVLVNQAGVTFYKGAQVNAQSLIVSSANVSNANFMEGKLAFDRAGNPNARVENQGTITVKQAGLAALVAPSVANSGTINARLGHVVLAGVKTATLDLYGDGLLSVDVTNRVRQAPVGADGKQVTALVTNDGVIRADGGTVRLTAAAADGVLRDLVRAGGTISANSVGAANGVGSHNGTVTVAGIGGSVSVTGLVDVSGKAENTTGGQVAVNATGGVTLASKARVDASGVAGGGTVAIGTTLQRALGQPAMGQRAAGDPGTASTLTAANVTVRKGAQINAGATRTGDGGRIVVLSGGTTRMHGTISAAGGSESGNGGFVEVSGKTLELTGPVDLSARRGAGGTLLLDPIDLVIVNSGTIPGSMVDGEFNAGTLAFDAKDGNPPPSTLNASTIEQVEGTVVIQATGTIDIRAPFDAGSGLTIQAGGKLTIETGATITSGGAILLQSGIVTPSAGMAINAGVTAFEDGLKLISGTGGIVLNGNLSGSSVDLNATGGGISQTSGGGINTSLLLSSNGVAGNVSLLGSNTVGRLGTFAVTSSGTGSAGFQLADNSPLSVAGKVSAPGNVYLQSSDPDGIFIDTGGTVVAGGAASFQTDVFAFGVNPSVGPVGTITAATFELAPNKAGTTETLGNGAAGLVLNSLANINAASIRIGTVTPPAGAVGPFTTAAAISVAGTFDVLGRNLELNTGGAIDVSAGALINVATLSGTGGDWALPGNNTVTNLGNVTATSFELNDGVALTVNGALRSSGAVEIFDTGLLAIDGSVSGTAIVLTGDSINIPGLVTAGGGTVLLTASTGGISETGTLIAGTLSGSALTRADFPGAGASVNQIARLGGFIPVGRVGVSNFSASSVTLRDGAALTVVGTVAAAGAAGQIFLSSISPAGITIAPTATLQASAPGGTVSLLTDALTNGGALTATTFELAPATLGGTVTLGASPGGLSLVSLAGVSAATVRVGAVTLPGAVAPSITAGAVAIAATFDASRTSTLVLDASGAQGSGAISQSAPLTGVGTLAATGASVILADTGNRIGASSGITASSGDIVLVDGVNLTLNGVYSGQNLFFEVASKAGDLTIGGNGPATLSAAASGRISLVADGLTAGAGSAISTAGGTVELSPFSAIDVSLAGGGGNGMLINAALLSSINTGAGTLLIGGHTDLASGGTVVPGGPAAPGTTIATTAAGISFDGVVDLTGRAGTLALFANGAVSEPGGPLTVGTVTGISGGDFSLSNVANKIQASIGIIANNGGVAVVDDPTLQLTGTYSGNSLFFQVTLPGGSLALGDAQAPATLVVPTGGRIGLVADGITATSASTITAPLGTLELAPFSAINESVVGTNNNGQLLIDATLLGDVNVGGGTLNTLVIGGYTNPRAPATGPVASAGGVTLDGPLNLTTVTTNLQLLSQGSVAEAGGPLTVANVFGASSGTFSLANPANAITRSLGITAGTGDVVLVNGGDLTLTGAHGGKDLFFEVASKGATLSLGTAGAQGSPATLTAATGGRISLVADQMTSSGGSTLTATGGTVELAPFSPLGISLLGSVIAGQLLIDPALLASISPGLGTLTIGGFTNVPAGATVATPSAASLTIDGTVSLGTVAATLDLQAIGAITQAGPPVGTLTADGPLIGVGTLAATGGSVTLSNPGNQIVASSGITATAGDVTLVDGTSLVMNGAYSGNNLFFEVAAKGGTLTIGASGPATLIAAAGSAAAGGRISLVADGLSANTAGAIGSPGGTVELAPFSPINVSLAGTGGNGMLINAALLSNIDVGTGTLLVGGFTPRGGSTLAGSITLDGAVNLSGRAGTLKLLANGAITEPGGPLNVATVTGVAGGGDFSLGNAANQIQSSTGMIANNGTVVLLDHTSLRLVGGDTTVTPFHGNNLFFEVTQPSGTLALDGVLMALNLGRASLVADNITATGRSAILAGGTVELAPLSSIDVSVGGAGAPGVLTIGAALLSNLSIRGGSKGEDLVNTLVIGGYTSPATGAITVSARNITVDGTVNVGGALALELLSNGSVTEPGGAILVTKIEGSAATGFTLTNPGNEIASSLGITAGKGDVMLVDGTDLALTGAHSGNNLFFEVTRQGGTLQVGTSDAAASLAAAPGGRITLVADRMTENAASTVSARGGTMELAPFSPINVSLAGSSAAGQLLIDPTLLSIVTPGLTTVTVGGFTNAAAGTTTSASSISIDGPVTLAPLASTIKLLAAGAVTQSAPIVNVGTLVGATGATTLTNQNNSVGVLGDYTAGNGFALTDATSLLIAGTVAAGPSATFTVNGALTETGGIVANRLSGGAIGTADLSGGNRIAELNGFVVGGATSGLTFNPGGDLTIAGTLSANRIVVSAPSNRITFADGVSIVTGGSTRPSSAVPPASLLPANGAPGTLLQAAGFNQIGRGSVSGLNGGPSTLQVSVTGDVRFDASAGLSGPGTWLILTLTDGAATGNVFIKALDLSYIPVGSANLFGSINGVRGVTAAGLGHIQPNLNNRYLFNNCEIGSAACLLATQSSQLLPTETTIFVPVDALLAQVTPALILDPQDTDDLLESPVVSREDY